MRQILILIAGVILGSALTMLFFLSYQSSITGSVTTPSDTISTKDISVFPDKVIIKVSNATVSRYEDSGSMLPFISSEANGIRIKPQSPDDINIGDIVSFNSTNGIIVHRVVEKGYDSEGVYFITRGDNSPVSDTRIRFNDIIYKTVGILY
jgi:signal peptidase I